MAARDTHAPYPAPTHADPPASAGASRRPHAHRRWVTLAVTAALIASLGGWLILSRSNDRPGTGDVGLLFVEIAGDGLAAQQGAALTVANELLPQSGLPVLQVQFLGDDMGTVAVVLAEMPSIDAQSQAVDALIASGLATRAQFHRGAVDDTGAPVEPERYVPWL